MSGKEIEEKENKKLLSDITSDNTNMKMIEENVDIDIGG